MHEFTIVQSMLDMCKKHSKGKKVDKVVVDIGKMSGIEPHFLKESFDTFKENTVCDEAVLDMNIIDITIVCDDCKAESKIENYDFFCPKCHSGNTKVLTGQEMHIQYLELKEIE